MKMIRVAWVASGKNLADMLTKPLNGPTLHAIADKVMCLVADEERNDSPRFYPDRDKGCFLGAGIIILPWV